MATIDPSTSLRQRRQLVREQLEARGIRDPAVLRAMESVPREAFVPERLHSRAYEDMPLPIGHGQTISQPYIVAVMTEALQLGGDERALEVGTGSGYGAAVLGEIVTEVYTLERHEDLAEEARRRLHQQGYDNVVVGCRDGTRGWPSKAPFDAIVVTAGGPEVPPSLREQLAVGGRLVIPVGRSSHTQRLVRVTRVADDEWEREDLAGVRFVPLVGAEGWHGDA